MSTRTIIEINHDELHRLAVDRFGDLELWLQSLGSIIAKPPPGIRVLGVRHHSERMKLVLGKDATERSIEE